MIFCKCQVGQNIRVSLGNKLINKVNETTFLGVIIDDELNWHRHIKQTVSKLQKNYYVIKRASRLLSIS